MSDVFFTDQHFDELSTRELYRTLQGRAEVFIVEQDCPYQDLDGVDLVSRHLAAWRGPADAPVLLAYCRVVPPGIKYAEPSIGRVISTTAGRRTGLGRTIVARAVAACEARYPGQGIRISAQEYLRRFYGDFGFVAVSDVYLEDNIDHVEMLRA